MQVYIYDMIIYAYNIQYNMIFYNLVVHDNLGHDLGVYKARSRFEHRWLRYWTDVPDLWQLLVECLLLCLLC